MPRDDWRKYQLGQGFYELVEDTHPNLTKELFRTGINDQLRTQNFPQTLDDKLVNWLYRKTVWCVRQVETLPKMRSTVRSRDWRHARACLGKIIQRDIPTLQSRIENYRKPEHPLTDAVLTGIHSLLQACENDIRLIDRLAAKEEKLVSGFLRPQLESQWMMELDGGLRRRLPKRKQVERRQLIAACALTARLLPPSKAGEDVLELINSRIERARRSSRIEASRYRWDG